MMRGEAEPAQGRAVLRRRIAGIGLPSVARIAPRQGLHDPVAPHLGDDRSGGDRKGEMVAADDGLDRATERRSDVAVDEGAIRTDPERGEPSHRFNDGKCDRQGRYWAGTMDDVHWAAPVGGLYRLDPDRQVSRLWGEVACANGLGWSPDDRVFYFGESFRFAIFAYDFDPDRGAIANRRLFASIDRAGGAFPDGLTVDAEGGVWSVHNSVGRVVRYAPTGAVTHVVTVPVPQPTSCIFGGARLDTLYVTTSRQNMTAAQLAAAPLSGSLFAVRPGLVGLPEPSFAG